MDVIKFLTGPGNETTTLPFFLLPITVPRVPSFKAVESSESSTSCPVLNVLADIFFIRRKASTSSFYGGPKDPLFFHQDSSVEFMISGGKKEEKWNQRKKGGGVEVALKF